jgi:GNAT superfamily N-acetyltransferase/catechol 2,3-dioxygenase-like lactoylglutathione lyase family enzyme
MGGKAYRTLRPSLRVFPSFYRFRHRIRENNLERDRTIVAAALDRIEYERQNRAYLVGEAFTVADLTAAALAHLCFRAPGRKAVDAFYAAALAAGGRDDGSPGLRPQYHADYYCAFVLDPDGHRIEAVCHAPESPIIQAAGGRALPSEIENVTAKTRDAAIELLVRFFREGGFSTPRSRIAENFDRMLADPLCWSALAADGEAAQAVITVSTVLYVEWGRLGEIGDLYVLPEHRRNGLARRLVEHAKAWCRAQGCSVVSVTITPAGERRHRLSHFYTRLGFAHSDRISALATLHA